MIVGEESGGKAGRNDCGDYDNVMQQISGNGEEKLPVPFTSVAVSSGNTDEPVLLF